MGMSKSVLPRPCVPIAVNGSGLKPPENSAHFVSMAHTCPRIVTQLHCPLLNSFDWLISCTLAYAGSRKSSKTKRYALFMKHEFTKAEFKVFFESSAFAWNTLG